MTIVPRLAYKLDAELGEGPIWSEAEQALWCVDIKRGNIHRFDPSTGACRLFDVGGAPSFIVPADDGHLLVGSGSRVYRLEDGRPGEPLFEIDQPARNRMNDATVDSFGRLWFGTMDDEEQVATGAIHCFDRGLITRTHWRAVVTNGPAVCGTARWLYHVDTKERAIWRIPFGAQGLATSGEIFVRLSPADGFPDGIVVDSKDCLWVALWGGWGVRRYAPDGRLLAHIELPCALVTKLAFGGPGLRTAYVTTARTGLTQEQLVRQPLAGGLFTFPVDVPGREVTAVRVP